MQTEPRGSSPAHWRNRDRCRSRRPSQSWSPPASVRSPDAHPRSNRFQNTAYTFPRSVFKINLLSAFCAGLSMWNPHTCGEKTFIGLVFKHQIGSPPRGRGKVKGTGQIAVRSRITPAWAGKRRCISRTNTSAGDHPRVGGEKRVLSSLKKPE